MWYNFKITLRNLRRNSLYSILNVAGLAVSITAVILIMFWVLNELSYDRFYKQAKDIYLVTAQIEADGTERYMSTPTAVANSAKYDIPDVKNACAVNRNYDLGFLEYNNEKYFGDRYISVDTTFFNIFHTTFIEGSAANALPDPYSVVLTQTLAKKIFGDEPALGKEITGSNGQGIPGDAYHVSAVVADQPKNSYLQYDAVFSFERSRFKNTWYNWSWDNFVLLEHSAEKDEVSEKLLSIQQKNFPGVNVKKFLLRPLTSLNLYDAAGKETGMASVRLFFLIALALLVIACINYVNLTTARSSKRIKEIAVKKILGAKKRQLFFQLINETVVLCVIAFVAALLLVPLLIPYYRQIVSEEINFSLSNPLIWIVCGCMFIVVIFLSGIYPALRLASFHPLNAFRPTASGKKSRVSLRKVLVVFQFISIAVFILSTIVMNRQLHYIQHKQLGYDREQVLTMQTFTNVDIRNHYQSFKDDLEKEPAISGVTASQGSILYAGMINEITWQDMPEGVQLNASTWGIDRNLFRVLDITLLEGSGFSGTPADSLLCFLNETAVREMNLQNPVGKTVSVASETYTVAGVVKDFHFTPLNMPITPLLMYLPDFHWQIYVKIHPQQTAEALASVEKVWKKYSPDFPVAYQFLDEAFDRVYQSERQRNELSNYFSLIAILISCLGLFGLVTFTAETRTKEIGIRKVIGASVQDIVLMLSKEFILLVSIALVISLPPAYYWLEKMLQDYAYHINISWWIFAATAGITLLLTLLTVTFKSVTVASTNPVNAIKTE